MKRTKLELSRENILFPAEFAEFTNSCDIYDSSCSTEARVFFIDKDGGYYLKCSGKGALEKEALMAEYFASKKLTSEFMGYVSCEKDWMMTRKVNGEDGTHAQYLSEPEKLCDLYALSLRELHETDHSDCPIQNRTADYLESARRGYEEGKFDTRLFSEPFFKDGNEAWEYLISHSKMLKCDTLIHGDYCLPNIIFEGGKRSGFIDLGNGGVGDRHIDIFWGVWSLWFNLKTDKYTDRFFDAYGRDKTDPDVLKVIASAEVFG